MGLKGDRMAPKRRIRRPAAAPGPVRRRPSVHVPPVVVDQSLRDINLAELGRLGFVQLTNAGYYGREVQVAGQVLGMKMAEGQTFLDLRVSGTQDDVLLRSITGRASRMMEVHICPADCAKEIAGEFVLHGDKFTRHARDREAWFVNVENVVPLREENDELAALREAAEGELEVKGGLREKSPKEEKKEKKRSKDKKSGKERKEADAKKREEKDDEEEAEEEDDVGKKDLAGLFAGTGLDPSPKKRQKFMKKARRAGKGKKKKKKKEETESSGSSSSSSSSSAPGGSGGQGLFN